MATVDINQGDLDAQLFDIVHDDLERRAYNVENFQKRLLRLHGTGRIYTTRFYRDKEGRLRKGGPRVPHQASAPGEPPAADTGQLLNSIHHKLDSDGDGQYAWIGTDLAIGTYLELGTRYMDPRPFLRPSLVAAADDSEPF